MASTRGNRDAALHAHGDRHGHGSRRDYLIGFAASVVLTAVPFWLVMTGALHSTLAAALIIGVLAITQIITHVRFFLHVDTRGEGGWTLISFIFTAIIVVITIGGSIWAMYQMNANMMPVMAENVMRMD